MHGFRLGTIASAALVAAAPAVGSASEDHVPTTGSQIVLGVCVASPCASTFPGGEPFFTRHGFVSDGTREDSSVLLDPQTRFELTVDGQELQSIVDLDFRHRLEYLRGLACALATWRAISMSASTIGRALSRRQTGETTAGSALPTSA